MSIGLSTQEMPLNTLVGSWKGSVGLCTTGQILDAGRWTSAGDMHLASFGHGRTVGVLVYVDDSTAFQTWDGDMVNATVAFSVDGKLVRGAGGGGHLTLAIPKEEEVREANMCRKGDRLARYSLTHTSFRLILVALPNRHVALREHEGHVQVLQGGREGHREGWDRRRGGGGRLCSRWERALRRGGRR